MSRLDPVYRQPAGAGAYARLVESLTRLTDVEPDETFATADVIALGEELCRRFQARVRSVGGDAW